MRKVGRKSVAAERRAQILDAFQRCAVRKGVEGTSLREVAREAGIPVSNLHHYFENRDEMVCELVRRLVDRLMEELEAQLRDLQDPERRIKSLLEMMFGPETQRLDFGALFYDCWSLAHRSETVRQVFQTQIREHRARFIGALRAAPEFSGVSKGDLREIANILIALVEGAYYLLDMDGANVSPKRMARLTRDFLRLYAADRDREKTQTGGKGR